MKYGINLLRLFLFTLLLIMAVGAIWLGGGRSKAQGVSTDLGRETTAFTTSATPNRESSSRNQSETNRPQESEDSNLEAGQEFENVGGRNDWFYSQRAYPLSEIPDKARERAFATRPVGDKNAVSLDHIVQSWTAIGPSPTKAFLSSIEGLVSGRINAIAVSPTDSKRILIGSATGGIWRSLDGGSNFTPVSDAQAALAVGAIAFAPSDSTVVYAGMGDLDNGYLGSGMLKSTNSGDNWVRVDTSGLPSQEFVTSIAVDPANSQHLFVTTSTGSNPLGKFSGVGDGGLYESITGGQTWNKPLSGNMSNVVFKPSDSKTLYITWLKPSGGLAPGLWRSTDSGLNWKAIDTPNYNLSLSDMRVAVTPADPKKVYVYGGGCTTSGKNCNFAVRFDFSSDSGDTFSFFTAAGGAPQVNSYSIPQPPPNPPLVSAPGAVDMGQFGYNTYLAVDPGNANTIYIGSRDLYRSTDGGQTFNNITKVWALGGSACNTSTGSGCQYIFDPTASLTLTHSDQQSIAISPSDSNKVYIGNDGGLYQLQFSGGSASVTSLNSSLSLTQMVGYAVHPSNDLIAYTGSQDNGQQARGLDPSANIWTEIGNGDGGDCVIDFADPTRAYTTWTQGSMYRFKSNGAANDGKASYGATSAQIADSTTFGECALPCSPRMSFYPPFIGASFEERLYFGTWKLFTSTDNGNTWTVPTTTVDGVSNQDIVDGGTNYLTAIGVARDSSTGKNVIYAGSAAARLKVSIDGGVTFNSANSGLPNRYITSITIDQAHPSIAYATVSGFGSGHVFKTTDTGHSWNDISGVIGSGGLSDVPANTLAIDPNDANTIYVGTDIGVYRSTVGGSIWQDFNQGMPPVPIMKLAVQPSTKNIHAATYGRGAYELISTVVRDTVDGYVKLDGSPLSGVTVNLSGVQSASTTTDSSGHYSFSNLIGGSYAVSAAKTGYSFAPFEQDINVNGNMTLPDFVAGRQYVAVTDFTLAQNPNGVWTYGYSNGSGFHTFTVAETNENGILGLNHWANGTGESEPAVRFNNTSSTLNYYAHIHHPSNELSLHPGPNCERSVVRFTAPSTGAYDFFGFFEGIDDTPTTTDVAIALNGSNLQSGFINAFGQGANGGSYGFLFVVRLNAGDKIDFSVGCGSNNDYHEDSTGLALLAQQDGTATNNVISGRAITTCGQSLSGVLMTLTQTNTLFAISNFAFTDANGNYAFPNVDGAGTFTLKPSKAGYTFSPPSRDIVNPTGSFGIPEFVGSPLPSGVINGPILFQRGFGPSLDIPFNRGGQLYTVDPNSGNEILFGAGSQPNYSLDGTKVAFINNADLFFGSSTDYSTARSLVVPGGGSPEIGLYPKISPDKTQVAYQTIANVSGTLVYHTFSIGSACILDNNQYRDTSICNVTELNPGGTNAYIHPSWRPPTQTNPGSRLVFVRTSATKANVDAGNYTGDIFAEDVTIAANGVLTEGTKVNLTNNLAKYSFPSYSHDATRIAYVLTTLNAKSQPTDSLYVMNANGTNPVAILTSSDPNAAITIRHPAWSPDDTKIAYSDSNQIFQIGTDCGGQNTAVTSALNSSADLFPAWGPASANPPPTIKTDGTGLSPATTLVQTAGGSGFTLTVNGTNFVNGAFVHFGSATGGNAVTTFVNSTQLTAQIPASFVQTADANILVYVINPNLAQSNKVNFTVGNPVPTIKTDGSGLSLSNANVGSAFTLTINGANFVNGSTVSFKGVSHTPIPPVSATQLKIQMTANADTNAAGNFPLTVINPAPGGGASNAVNFTVSCPPITISAFPSSLPTSSKVTAAFNYVLQASGGTGPYHFTLSSGALPAGLKFSPNTAAGPVISGIASTAGAYTFTITATDSLGCVGSRTYTITIDGATAAPTNVGTNVTVTPGGIGSTTITYGAVSAPGVTNATPIDLSLIGQSQKDGNTAPSVIGSLPPGYQIDENSYAVDVTTTATVTPPITVCLNASWVFDPLVFAKLRVLHGEQGAFIDRTISQDFNTGNVCAQVNSLSPFVIATAPNLQIRFNAATYSVNEGGGSTLITVNRTGDTSNAATVRYATSDGTAKEGKDYTAAFGIINFAAGETSKNFTVLIIDNGYVAGTRTLNLTLSNPTGATLAAQSTAILNITENDTAASNPIDQARFFVQQHYYDFLGRYPDQSGWDFWTNEIASCGADQTCIGLKRINVSAAYFLSIEFQQTGYLVERIYKTAYGSGSGTSTFGGPHQLAVPVVRFNEFLPDTQQIGSGVVVGANGWETVLENNKQAFTSDFVQRSRFTSAFANTLTPAQFVDALFANAGVTPTAGDRQTVLNEFGTAATSADVSARARALRDVAENATLNTQEFNRAFVLMQYFGYLRRDPNGGQDADYTGFDFWLTKLNQFNGNFVNAEMVKAFITSTEYRQRFGP